jgi:hypothetical protein
MATQGQFLQRQLQSESLYLKSALELRNGQAIISATKLIGIVVPTLGMRQDMLIQCLTSIKAAGPAFVTVVGPQEFIDQELTPASSYFGLFDSAVADPREGLAAAINKGIRALPDEIELVTWLGDDDLLHQGALVALASQIASNPRASAVFGRCDFVDSKGKVFGRSRFGRFAVALLKFGPDLIPQPASLFRRKHFDQIGGLDTSLKLAFDLDLFLKLSKVGRILFLDQVMAQYRWHPDSLSASNQKASRVESRLVRYRALPKPIRPFSFLWEAPMEFFADKVRSLDKKENKV